MTEDTVLIIDTDTETIQNFTSILESQGYLVFAASSKDDSVNMAKRVNPSVVFINIGMSDVSSLEICNIIHNTEKFKNVPIVIITERAGTIDSRYSDLYGIVDFLIKPFNSKELIEKIENVLAMKFNTAQPNIEEDIGFDESIEVLEKEREMREIQNQDTEKTSVLKNASIDIGKSVDSSDTNQVTNLTEDVKLEDYIEQAEVPNKELDKIINKYRDDNFLSKKRISRRKKKNRLFVPIIIVVTIFIISLSGIVLHKKGFLPWTSVQTPVSIETPLPVQQQDTEVPPIREQEEQLQLVEENVQAPASAPESKPEGKTIYSVQIGAFRNKNSAERLTNKFKEKGYDAFTFKGTSKENVILHRVLIGKFENRRESSRLADSIRTKEKVKVTIFSGTNYD